MGPPGFSDHVTIGTEQRDSIRTIMRRILIRQLKDVKQFSDLWDKSFDLAETYLKLTPLSLGFCHLFGISEKCTV